MVLTTRGSEGVRAASKVSIGVRVTRELGGVVPYPTHELEFVRREDVAHQSVEASVAMLVPLGDHLRENRDRLQEIMACCPRSIKQRHEYHRSA